ncbi:MAG: YeeE/YedE thiosulfate transporter family protein [Candidatus Hydrogenedentota bacterium]
MARAHRPSNTRGWKGKRFALLACLLCLVFFVVSDSPSAQPMGSQLTQPLNGKDVTYIWTLSRWSPYAVGIGIGVLSWLAFLLSDHPLGVSTAYARTSGMLERVVRGKKVDEKAYYREYPPTIDWEWMLVVGLLVGAFLSSWMSGAFRWEVTPPLWRDAFGDAPVARLAVALAGGFLVGFGARWAGGCTSGHGISGALQLVLSGWVALLCFFAGGVIMAMLTYYVIA